MKRKFRIINRKMEELFTRQIDNELSDKVFEYFITKKIEYWKLLVTVLFVSRDFQKVMQGRSLASVASILQRTRQRTS
jgi:hypothetical protein